MVKIWGKILKHERIVKSKTIVVDEKITTFFDMLKELSNELNVSTPVLLDKHVYDFNLFHTCTFRQDDFIETVDFDKLILQLLSE